MKKIAGWVAAIALLVFVVVWGIVGLKIADNNYLFTAEAYLGLVSLMVFFVCVLYLKLIDRCPHCGKTRQTLGRYCPYCVKEIG